MAGHERFIVGEFLRSKLQMLSNRSVQQGNTGSALDVALVLLAQAGRRMAQLFGAVE